MEIKLNKNVQSYLDQVIIDNLNDQLIRMNQKLEWMDSRIRNLENSLLFYQQFDTKGASLFKKKFYEFKNTISNVLYPRRETYKLIQDQNLRINFSIIENRQSALSSDEDRIGNFKRRFPEFSYKLKATDIEHKRPKVYLDLTNALSTEKITGIQRTAWNIATYGLAWGLIPVFCYKQNAYTYDCLNGVLIEINFKENDIFLMSDALTIHPIYCDNVMRKANSAGSRNVAIIYDLFPIDLADCTPIDAAQSFKMWFYNFAIKCDELICISKATAENVLHEFESKSKYLNKIPKISHWTLGCDFNEGTTISESRKVLNIINKIPNFFLTVSTLEPRKGYTFALDAIEGLWSKDIEVGYVIIGRYGWLQEKLVDRILKHPEYNRRLFWVDDASDTDLECFYKHAYAFVFPSIAEGFGLGIIEAAHYSTPIIASDIPVFREIAGDEITYFETGNSEDLKNKMLEVLRSPKANPRIASISWKQSTNQLIKQLMEQPIQGLST